VFVSRKPFLFNGTQYMPGDVIKGFPEEFNKSESFIRAGMVVERPDPVKKPAKKMEQVVPVVIED